MLKLGFGRLSARLALTMVGAALTVVSLAGPSHAAVTLKTNRGDLGATDFIDWGVLGPAFTVVPNPTTLSANSGTPVTISIPSGSMERRNQSTGGWAGNFAPGDHLIWTRDQPGPLTLEFGAPLVGVGAQIERDAFGAFNGMIEAFDSGNVSLGSFTVPGNGQATADNSAIFIGVLSDTANIKKIKFGVDNNVNAGADFAINRVDIAYHPSTPAAPEPATMTLLGTGVIGLLARRRRAQA